MHEDKMCSESHLQYVYLADIISCILKRDKVLGKTCKNLSDRQAATVP